MSRPTPLTVRRARGWRPLHYSSAHRLVAALFGLGKSRQEIAAITGYTPAHISRITGMAEARRDAEQVATDWGQALVEARVAQLMNMKFSTR